MGQSGSTSSKMSEAKTLVDTKIAGKRVVVFSKSYCPYCTRVKKIIEKYVPDTISQDDVEYVEMDDLPECDAMQDYLKKLTGAKTVPRVFINGKSLGGSDKIAALDSSGQLAPLMKT